jgi:Uma2 family endonuclease
MDERRISLEHRNEISADKSVTEKVSWDDFLKLEKESDNHFEYDGITVTAIANPSRQHQRLSVRLTGILDNVLEGSKCEVIPAPFSLMYDYEYKGAPAKQCLPDLLVRCYKDDVDEDMYPGNKYYGVPLIIIEIISPSNFSDDYNKKKLIYEKLGVLEYVIVNMYTREVLVYTYDHDTERYDVGVTFKDGDVFTSSLFDGFSVDISELLHNIQVSQEDLEKVTKRKIIPYRGR